MAKNTTDPHPQVTVAKDALAEGDRAYQIAAEAMKVLADDGWPQRKIAEQVGCSQKRVSLLLQALEKCTSQGVQFGEAYAEANNPQSYNRSMVDQARRAQQVRARLVASSRTWATMMETPRASCSWTWWSSRPSCGSGWRRGS
jgi:hypothetical protein